MWGHPENRLEMGGKQKGGVGGSQGFAEGDTGSAAGHGVIPLWPLCTLLGLAGY